MKKCYILLVMLILCVVASAGNVTPNEAMALATSWLGGNHGNRVATTQQISHENQALTLAHKLNSPQGETDVFIFNRANNGGFILIAGDDAVSPVLGYCDEGSFDPDNIPPQMQWLLSEYSRELAFARTHNSSPRKTVSLSTSVSPLIQTQWDQDAPYNNECPSLNSSQTVTGCVATAMAQIMYYYKWPLQGTGNHSYTWNSGTLSADFSQSTYDWNNMCLTYSGSETAEQNAAVAKLMSDCGISVDMEYNVDSEGGSGAVTAQAPESMKTYFGYSQYAGMLYRNGYGIDEWESMLRQELDAKRPVLYCGQGSGGHAFVVDGYDTHGYFHVNWGWSGSSNGYFLITVLNPNDTGIGAGAGTYNSEQQMSIYLMPDASYTGSTNFDDTGEKYFDPYVETLTPNVSSVALGGDVTVALNGIRYTGAVDWTKIYRTIRLYDEQETRQLKTSTALSITTAKPGYSYQTTRTLTIPENLPDGTYRIYAYCSDNDNIAQNYVKMRRPVGCTPYIEVTVHDGTAYFDVPSPDVSLTVTDLEASEYIYAGKKFNIKALIKNEGSEEFYDNVYVALMQNSTVVKRSSAFMVNICGGESHDIETILTAVSTAGDYQLVVLDKNYNPIGEGIPVTLLDPGSGTESLSLVTNIAPAATKMPINDVRAKAVVRNDGDAPFVGHLKMRIWYYKTSTGISSPSIVYSNLIVVAPGETETAYFTTSYTGPFSTITTNYLMSLIDPANSSTTNWGGGSRPSFKFIDTEIEAETKTASELLASAAGKTYKLLDNNLTAVSVSDDGLTIYAKDDNGCANPSVNAENKIDYVAERTDLMANRDYDQSNWVVINLPQAMTEAEKTAIEGHKIKALTAQLSTSGTNEVIATFPPEYIKSGVAQTDYQPNVYTAANFLPDHADNSNYFFVKPKNNELAYITWAVWDNTSQTFYVPSRQGGHNNAGLAGGFKVDMSLCAGASSTDPRDTYVAGEAYKIFALIKQQAPATSGDAPARLQGNTVAHSTEFTVYPLAVPEAGDIVTAVVTVRSDNAPIGTTYYDLAGHASDRPFHGVNIIVKRHINGETTVSKQVMP